MKAKEVIIEVCAILLIVLYIYTATSKLANFEKTYFEMNNQPFDNRFTLLLVWGIPAIEILIAGLLSFNRTRLLGFIGSAVLMLLFTGYVGLVLSNYYGRIPCSCGGAIKMLTWPQHLVFNSIFVIISCLGLYLTKGGDLWRRRSQSIRHQPHSI